MDQSTIDFLTAMEQRVTSRQAAVENQLQTAVNRLTLLQSELVDLYSKFRDAYVLEPDEPTRGQIYEYEGTLQGLSRRINEAVEALTRLRIQVRQLDEVDSRVGDLLRGQ